jgi:6-phosphogluconolactonase
LSSINCRGTGRYLLAASDSGNKISLNTISPDGRVEPKPRQVIPSRKNAHAVRTDLRNRHLFVTNLGDDQIPQFQFDERRVR